MIDQNTVPQWRSASADDVAAIHAIGASIHRELPERPEIFTEKFRLFPSGTRVLTRAGLIVGYGMTHPWRLYAIPPLNTFLKALPAQPDGMLIHGVAVLPDARGHGAAEQFVRFADDAARSRGIAALALVSVYDTYPLWMRCGFTIAERPHLSDALRTYGGNACYMVRTAL